MATNKNEHLKKVIDTHNINNVEHLSKFIAKKNKVKDALNNKYSNKKASNSIDSGSYAKNTAINTKFDIDCCIPFRKKTKGNSDEKGFETLSEMFEDVYKYLKNEYTKDDDDISKEHVRKQKVSIGMKFDIDGEEFDMDVVPGRERPNNNDYNDNNTDLSLYINPSKRSKKEDDDEKTRIKTNIKTHVGLLNGANRTHERRVTKLLKVWKTERKNQNGGKLIKSFMMELYTKEAFDNSDEVSGLWEQVKLVMNYIIDNIETTNLVDPANSSNIISDSMSDTAKTQTKRDMKNTIKEVDEDSDKIKEYFPINDEFDDDNDSSSNNASKASILTTSKFG